MAAKIDSGFAKLDRIMTNVDKKRVTKVLMQNLIQFVFRQLDRLDTSRPVKGAPIKVKRTVGRYSSYFW